MAELDLINQKLAYRDSFEKVNMPNVDISTCGNNKIIADLSPETEIPTFCNNLLKAAENICEYKYQWKTRKTVPAINNNTTYNYLFENWFRKITYL
jgi:hypothetical protein